MTVLHSTPAILGMPSTGSASWSSFAQRYAHKENRRLVCRAESMALRRVRRSGWRHRFWARPGPRTPPSRRSGCTTTWPGARAATWSFALSPSPRLCCPSGTSKTLLDELLTHIKDNLGAGTVARGSTPAPAGGAASAGGPGAPPRRAGFQTGAVTGGDAEGEAVVDADVRTGQRERMSISGDGDIGSVDPRNCTLLP